MLHGLPLTAAGFSKLSAWLKMNDQCPTSMNKEKRIEKLIFLFSKQHINETQSIYICKLFQSINIIASLYVSVT